ncbi:MAG: hypothetical protein QGH58_04405 [Arenicellales bacterium]|jgi:hypothetical protein|nr:hypothetical protein [Arenicellales bacterium]MDP6552790.1 hypothetical protein [Arenicellales bacterium]MDP6791134.1 hypothetical protein [Arenicellales bacterium]MDP6918866.1 hypothetical protein [Arenicellales bacterium]|tara:strand:+ start:256 stop:537 length:282 start_codon:yes stop_codon:yes gene_type:complete
MTGMAFFDTRKTGISEQRETEQFAPLGSRLCHVNMNAQRYGEVLSDIDPNTVADRLEPAEHEDAKEFHLGVSGEGRRSFRNTKAYRRRKRWLS